MIDIKTGKIYTKPSISPVGPSLTREKFLSSPMGKDAKIFVNAGKSISYKSKPLSIYGVQFILVLYFSDQRLIEIHLYPLSDEKGGWASYSEANEIEKKRKNDAFLAANLGAPPYEYPWGEIVSIFDDRSGASQVIVRFRTVRLS
jgi:hypothetical protein